MNKKGIVKKREISYQKRERGRKGLPLKEGDLTGLFTVIFSFAMFTGAYSNCKINMIVVCLLEWPAENKLELQQ